MECLIDGPSVESELHQYYLERYPQHVVVVGADIFNGSTAALQSFRNTTGVTYALLLNAAATSGGNMFALYGDRDNFIVIDSDANRTIRFNARQQGYPYGAALDAPRVRALVDSLLATTVGVEPSTASIDWQLSIAPNPAAGAMRFELRHPGVELAPARAEVLDLAGRRVASLAAQPHRGELTAWGWDGRDLAGTRVAAGIYFVRVRLGERELLARVARLR
ncbi:MAG: hypothetical protein HOP12_16235 [Candidatus Eisenbacteria bacterium]|uniref:T9SS type A sorting domain-containing protein n=1 Tax=Eiseniibacteriota bacterium TaxID=2212470 RepID=A0A849SWG1_UNCEI|nr:hypothetical protein [Candidatus Eisenbacteria bacterium]